MEDVGDNYFISIFNLLKTILHKIIEYSVPANSKLIAAGNESSVTYLEIREKEKLITNRQFTVDRQIFIDNCVISYTYIKTNTCIQAH